MKNIKKHLKLFLLSVLSIVALSCDNDDDNNGDPFPNNVIEVALNNNFTSLATALTNTGLVSTLQGEGPFTVFAPTNDALDSFLSAAGIDINNMTAAQEDAVRNILLNHVIVGEYTNANSFITSNAGYKTTGATGPGGNNLNLYFSAASGSLVLNGGATVIAPDNYALNGVVHVIDEVIALPTVVTFATSDPTFSTLASALTTATPATDFASILSRTSTGNMDGIDPDFTVFAPTNDAFNNLLDSVSTWNSLSDIGETTLTNVLLHHVIGGANIRSSNLNPMGTTTAGTLEGDNITITLPGTNGNIANVQDGSGNTDIGIVAVDVQASNGVIHVLNKVMLNN